MSDNKAEKKAAEAPKAEEEVKTPEPKQEAPKPAPKAAPKDTSADDAALAAELLNGSISEANSTSAGAGGRATIRELLMDYFSPTELVTVKNPFDFDTGWVYSDPSNIKVVQPSAEDRQVYGIGRDFAKTRILRRGAELTIPGWEAYVGLTRFFKEWCQRKHPESISTSINNTEKFKKFMKEVYVGVFDPNKGKNSEIDSDTAARAALERDLGLV